MDTSNPQFQKAYTDLVTAFINFVNVVEPGSAGQPTLHFIASQLNQLLGAIEGNAAAAPAAASITTPAATTVPTPAATTVPATAADTPSVAAPVTQTTAEMPPVNPVTVAPAEASAPSPIAPGAATVVMYCNYPELFKERYKFKSSSMRAAEDGKPINERGSDYIYKLTLDEANGVGTAELIPLSVSSDPQLLKIVATNPATYTPDAICVGAAAISPAAMSIKSDSVVRIEKVVRGWVIAEDEKFVINVN